MLTLPALRAGFMMDDFLQRLVLEGAVPELGLGPASLYDFTGHVSNLSAWIERGYVPWFTDPALAIRFFRPLGSLSIALDQALFGRAALPSHVVGALLFVAVTALAFALFRRILSPNRAGLAALIFALASGHNLNLTWVAGRHVLIGGIFGALAVYAQVRRREAAASPRALGWLAPLALAFSMLASETSLAAAFMIATYELFAADALPRERARRAAPWLGAILVYLALYSAAGFGVRHSSLYISPLSAPGAFLAAALTRWPALLGELSFSVPSSVWGAAPRAQPILALVGALATLLVCSLAWRAAASEQERRRTRWLIASVACGTLPMVGGVPDGRVLLLPMLASAPLVATAIEHAFAAAGGARRVLLRVAGGALLFMHLLVAAIARAGTTAAITNITRAQRELAANADFSACSAASPLFVVTGADPSLCISGATSLRYYRPELSARHPSLAVLAIAPHDLTLERPSERELVLEVHGAPGPATIFERLFRDTPLVGGQSVKFEHFEARVLATENGLLQRAAFELPPDACLVTLEQRRLVGRPLPAVGSRRHIPHERGPLGL